MEVRRLVASRMCSTLGGEALFGGAGGDQFGQHFGAAEDHAEGILQIMRDGAEDLVLETRWRACNRSHCADSLRFGLHQRAGALGNTVFELGVGLVQLLIKNDVVERDRKPAAEKSRPEKRSVSDSGRSACNKDDDFPSAAGANVQDGAMVNEFVLCAA